MINWPALLAVRFHVRRPDFGGQGWIAEAPGPEEAAFHLVSAILTSKRVVNLATKLAKLSQIYRFGRGIS
jgi:hypothetical protein